ncbi:hypothetical protein PQX77_010260 [Marasmius sp. AFHP31]|nr:hypothetical protein PQX77_010260 [Marasmius sp. AFHP31]
MSGPSNGPYTIQNAETKKWVFVDNEKRLATCEDESRASTFEFSLVQGRGVYTIRSRHYGELVNPEEAYESKKLYLKYTTFEWTIQDSGSRTYNIGMALNDLWWDSKFSSHHESEVTLKKSSSDSTAWLLMPPRDD